MSFGNVNLYRPRPEHRFAYRGHSLLQTDAHARIEAGEDGVYFRRTRFLSRLVIKVEGREPAFASANPVEAHSMIAYYLAPLPTGAIASGSEIARKAIEIQINSYVGGGLHQDIHLTNHASEEAAVALSWEIDADFADQAEASEGAARRQTAPVERNWSAFRDGCGGELAFRYRHPDLNHATVVRIRGDGRFLDLGDAVSCRIALRPQVARTLSLDVIPYFLGQPETPFYGRDGLPVVEPDADAVRADWLAGCARLSAANPIVQTAWDRATADLASLQLLEGTGAERFTPAAGVPKYMGLFGRDALMAAWQSRLLNPATLRGSLGLIGRWTAHRYDDAHDAEPGKILHQRQLGPLALLGETPFARYYGDYSAPGLFLLGIAADLAQTGDREFFLSMRDKALETLEWMDRDGDSDGDGFYEYSSRAGEQGLKNQGWKDSDEAILHEDGRPAEDPIAVCEVQGLYYAARQAMALAFVMLGEDALGARLMEDAEDLKTRFNDRFWLPDEKFFALALDADKQPVRTVASNPGACLAYGIVDADKAASVADRLMAPDMFSGWGIRTLSSRHPAYNPLVYHLGTVWPSPSAVIACGLGRYGFDAALHRLAEGLFDASRLFHLARLPEVFGGHPRDRRHPHPGVYPGACAPQAWSASAIVLLVNSLLGVTPLAPLGTLIVDPRLPEWLPELTVHDIQVGSARVSLRFRRDPTGYTEYQILTVSGDLRVHRHERTADVGELPRDRMGAAIRAVLA